MGSEASRHASCECQKHPCNRPSERQLPPPEGTEPAEKGRPGGLDVGEKLASMVEAILTRTVNAVEERDRQPAVTDAEVIEDGDAPCE